jgi:hypothetical protein
MIMHAHSVNNRTKRERAYHSLTKTKKKKLFVFSYRPMQATGLERCARKYLLHFGAKMLEIPGHQKVRSARLRRGEPEKNIYVKNAEEDSFITTCIYILC